MDTRSTPVAGRGGWERGLLRWAISALSKQEHLIRLDDAFRYSLMRDSDSGRARFSLPQSDHTNMLATCQRPKEQNGAHHE